MWYIIIAVFFVVGVFFGPWLFSYKSETKINNNIVINSSINQDDTIKSMFSKEQLNNKLKHLAETPPPTKLSFGALCYTTVNINNTIHEYVCPVCGEKTIYKKSIEKDKFFLIDNILKFDLEACRRQVGLVKGINISLDETQFCSYCKPNTENPGLCLLVNVADQADTTRVCNITSKDIQLIQEFLSDKLVHKGDREEEYPLVNYSIRIKELLGFK